MNEVRVKVFKEIPLDKNLDEIKDKIIYNSVYLVCDEEEVYLGTVKNKEQLNEMICPEGIVDIYKTYLSEDERISFYEAFNRTDFKYVFNEEVFSVKGMI